MLRIYYAVIPETDWVESALPLSEYRRKRLSLIRVPLLRRQMIAAELLLNQAVRECYPQTKLPLHILTAKGGKPYLDVPPLCFSLSHSGVYAACALADFEIGMDLQRRSVWNEQLVRRCFSEEEQYVLRKKPDPDTAFTEFWALKESYLKATGLGLTGGLRSFSIVSSPTLRIQGREEARFWIHTEENFSLSVCALNNCDPIPEFLQKKELDRL